MDGEQVEQAIWIVVAGLAGGVCVAAGLIACRAIPEFARQVRIGRLEALDRLLAERRSTAANSSEARLIESLTTANAQLVGLVEAQAEKMLCFTEGGLNWKVKELELRQTEQQLAELRRQAEILSHTVGNKVAAEPHDKFATVNGDVRTADWGREVREGSL